MISSKLLNLIANREDNLAKKWSDQVKKTEYMKTYQRFTEEELIRRNKRFFEQRLIWLDEGASKSAIGAFFVTIGKDRYREKFPLAEIIHGVFIAKKVFWDVIISEAFLNTTAEVYQALETLTMIYNFFDKGNLYITRGYLEEMYTEISNDKKIPADEIRNYFYPGSFFKLDADSDGPAQK